MTIIRDLWPLHRSNFTGVVDTGARSFCLSYLPSVEIQHTVDTGVRSVGFSELQRLSGSAAAVQSSVQSSFHSLARSLAAVGPVHGESQTPTIPHPPPHRRPLQPTRPGRCSSPASPERRLREVQISWQAQDFLMWKCRVGGRCRTLRALECRFGGRRKTLWTCG